MSRMAFTGTDLSAAAPLKPASALPLRRASSACKIDELLRRPGRHSIRRISRQKRGIRPPYPADSTPLTLTLQPRASYRARAVDRAKGLSSATARRYSCLEAHGSCRATCLLPGPPFQGIVS
jgi:hypothetical protein